MGQRWSTGAVLKIALQGDTIAYAQMLEAPEVAVFDTPPHAVLSAAEAVQAPVAFRVWVHKRAYTPQRWIKIGSAPVPASLAAPIPRFSQDPLVPESFSIHDGGVERPSCREECADLERAAVWAPEHVEDRIRDQRAGRPNKWLESMRLSPPA